MPVPGVDHRDRDRQLRELGLAGHRGGALPDVVGDVPAAISVIASHCSGTTAPRSPDPPDPGMVSGSGRV